MKYNRLDIIKSPEIQAAGIQILYNNIPTNIFSIYCPPRHTISCEDYFNFFNKLGSHFIVGGDFNAKHPWWGSRLINPKGRDLYKCIVTHNYKTLSTGSPTYWPSDLHKIPDLLDFVVYKGIPNRLLDIVSSNELSSDHSALILNFHTKFPNKDTSKNLIKKSTDIKLFQQQLDSQMKLNIRIKTAKELDNSVEEFTSQICKAAAYATPQKSNKPPLRFSVHASAEIRKLIRQKRKLRKQWQNNRTPQNKTIFNRAIVELKIKLKEYKEENLSNYISSLNVGKNEEVRIWGATNYLKHPTLRNVPIKNSDSSWCITDKEKADAFASDLRKVFQPPANSINDNEINKFLESPCEFSTPIRRISPYEVLNEISKLNNRKSPGHDKIDALVAKSLPEKAVLFLTLVFNSILRLNHFPSLWKCAEVIMLPKPNKPENEVKSYRPISLLPVFSKIFERILLGRLLPIMQRKKLIPEHQFGFRHKHSTIEQCHRVVKVISGALEEKKYCSAVFLDIQKAFDKVWHNGLLFKIKKSLTTQYYLLIKSYLNNRQFYVRVKESKSSWHEIGAGVPQGSVLGPILYIIFTSDLPQKPNVTLATFADDTAIIASDKCKFIASHLCQETINEIEKWLQKWKVQVNSDKSTHITFTLRKGDCPGIQLNGNTIPHKTSIKYLGMHIDRRLTWAEHIRAKRKHLNIKIRKLYWLLGYKSELSLSNKLLLYKTLLKPVWTYGIQLWGTASESNIEILQKFQNKILRLITNAPWYIQNKCLHSDLSVPYIKDEISRFSDRYMHRLSNHENILAITLLDDYEEIRRLKRYHVLDLPFRK